MKALRLAWLALLAFSFSGIGTTGCVSQEKRESDAGWRRLRKIVLPSLRVRRPSMAGADPAVGPGGADYSAPVTASLNCDRPDGMYSYLNMSSFRACLKTIPAGTQVSYRLRRDPVPYWEMLDPKAGPLCLAENLGKVPVPREIVFQSKESGQLECYVSRLDIEWDELGLFHVKSPLKSTRLRIEFPLEKPETPGTDEELLRLLLTWSIRPFQQGPQEEFLSKLVPSSLCEACLGRGQVLGPHDPPAPHWPEEKSE